MRRTAATVVVLLLCGVGIWGAIDLTREHFGVMFDPDHESWCTFEDSNFDCAKVSTSRWAEHDLILFDYPTPTSIAPLGFFAALAVLVLLGTFRRGDDSYPAPQARDDTLAFAWLMLLPALCMDLALVYVMKFILHTWCIVCLAIDVSTVLTLAVLPLARRAGYRGLLRGGVAGALRHYNWAIFAAVFALVFVVGQRRYATEVSDALLQVRQEFVAQFDELVSSAPSDPLRGDEPHRGTPGAPFRVVEFADFQCPYCVVASHEVGALMEAYPGAIDFVFRHYPLSTQCHPTISRDMHPDACMAAFAAECAGRHDRFWEMYDALFELYPRAAQEGRRPTLEEIRGIAADLGLPASEFFYCMEEDDIHRAVTQDVADGQAAGVSGTPALFVNGVLLPGGANAPLYLEILIRDHLAAQGVDLPPPLTYLE